MSDAQLRELDRRWRREASVEAWTTYAAACARSGHRAPPADEADAWAPLRLALAARLGDADARRALALPEEPEPDDAGAWVERLEPSRPSNEVAGWSLWGRELFVRIATAAARAAAPGCRDLLGASIAATIVDRLERWAAAGAPPDKGSKERQALVDAHVETIKYSVRFTSRSPALLALTRAVSVGTSVAPANGAAGEAARHAALVVGAPTVVAQVRRELVPWTLFTAGSPAAVP